MWWYGPDMNGWGYALMTLSMLVFWGLVIGTVVAAWRYAGRDDRSADRPTPPEEVLAHRFAAGDIDEQEYRQRVQALREHRSTAARP